MSKPSHQYTEDQMPCIVARKACGCYVAACGIDSEELEQVKDWNIEADMDLPSIVAFLKEGEGRDATYEIRPVSFVRAGGLNFDCKCVAGRVRRSSR